MDYSYLIKSSINEMNEGIMFLINELNNEDSKYSNEYLSLYCEKILECNFNKFRNDDFEYLTASIVVYNGDFKFIPVELKPTTDALIVIYKQLKEKTNNIVRVKK